MHLKTSHSSVRYFAVMAIVALSAVMRVHAILAGDERALPKDSPANRLDTLGAASTFNSVGSLTISAGGISYIGSATAIAPNWILTTGHNLDLNDSGSPTAGLSLNFNLPGFGTFAGTSFYTCPGFTGFANSSIQRDLGLIYLSTPLPSGINYPSLTGNLQAGSTVTLAGFGRSGYGSYGYTTLASLTDRRIGYNVIDSFQADDLGGDFPAVFLYDYDLPGTTGQAGGSLGNNLETIIGPGDSGGPLLLADGAGYDLVGVNTFVEGYGGHFGDIGGGIVVAPYLNWIDQTMAQAVPEPSILGMCMLALPVFLFRRFTRPG